MLLSELIEAVKKDLVESAENRPAGDSPLFEIEDVTIETEVTAEKKITAEGGADIVLVNIATAAEQTNSTKHKISINLRALDSVGPDGSKIRSRGAKSA